MNEQHPSVWQTPDPQRAEERVRRLEASAARAQDSAELEQLYGALALARLDLVAHRGGRARLDAELLLRSEEIMRQRREVVELFEQSERRLLDRQAAGDDITRRLDAVRADLAWARQELASAGEEHRRMLGDAR